MTPTEKLLEAAKEVSEFTGLIMAGSTSPVWETVTKLRTAIAEFEAQENGVKADCQPTDSNGLPVPAGEPPETLIEVWEVTPHVQSAEYDYLLCRSWQQMLQIVAGNLDLWLERNEEEIHNGVTLRFRLVKMRKSDLDELEE